MAVFHPVFLPRSKLRFGGFTHRSSVHLSLFFGIAELIAIYFCIILIQHIGLDQLALPWLVIRLQLIISSVANDCGLLLFPIVRPCHI